MDDGGEQNISKMERRDLLAQLADALGMPVVALVSGWKGDHIVNFGEEASRAFLHVLDAELAAWAARDLDAAAQHADELAHQPDEIALFLVGRGGFPAFSDGVCRALRGRNLRATAVIPAHIDGAFSLIALGAHRRLMHPYGALGAYDRPALGRVRGALNGEILRELQGLNLAELAGGLPDEARVISVQNLIDLAAGRHQARLAARLLVRLLEALPADSAAENNPESGALFEPLSAGLSAASLGYDLGLSAAELTRLGVDACAASDRDAALIWQIFEAYEYQLQALEPPVPRYTESEIADEVEFAPAIDLTGALIEGPHRQLTFELDTGRPDPHTSALTGRWSWEMPDL